MISAPRLCRGPVSNFRSARLSAKSAQALRCESCGAALPADKPTCDYCGSHHALPVYQPGTISDSPVEAPWLSPRRLLVLVAVAAVAAGGAWLVLR